MKLPKPGDVWVRPDGTEAVIKSVTETSVVYTRDGANITVPHDLYFELAYASEENGAEFKPKALDGFDI